MPGSGKVLADDLGEDACVLTPTPGMVVRTLERGCAATSSSTCSATSARCWPLDPQRRTELDTLLEVDPELGRTPLNWLGVGPTNASPAAVKTEVDKLGFLRRLDAHTLDLSTLPTERRRFLAGVGRRLTGQALSRREPERRYPILLTLLAQSAVDVSTRCCCCSIRRSPGASRRHRPS